MAAADKAKFKVGDRVLVTANEDGEGEGKTAVVVWVCSPDWVHVRFEQPIDGWGEDGQEWGVGVEKLELLPAAEATSTLKYGDIVRCIEDYDGQFTAGKEYIVRHVYREGENARIAVVEDDRGSETNGWLASKFVPVRRSLDEPVKTWLEKEIESGRMSVDAARAQLGHDPVPTDTAGYTVPLCAFEESEADKAGDLVINVASNLSEINDELRTAIKLVKKLGKASKKYGIDIAHYTAAA